MQLQKRENKSPLILRCSCASASLEGRTETPTRACSVIIVRPKIGLAETVRSILAEAEHAPRTAAGVETKSAAWFGPGQHDLGPAQPLRLNDRVEYRRVA